MLDHPDVRKHTWESGFEAGIHFCCMLLKMPDEKIRELRDTWLRQSAMPVQSAKPKVTRRRAKG